MKNILVPTDFSKEAGNALRFAIELARTNFAKIHLLFVAEVPLSALDPEQGSDNNDYGAAILKKLKQKGIEKLIAMEKLYRNTVDITSKVETGIFQDATLKYIAENQIDQVIMGTTGASGIKEWTIGSNAEKMVRFATCPVITLSKRTSSSKINKIVFGINMTDEVTNVLEKLKAFQSLLGADLELILIKKPHMIESEKILTKQMEDFAQSNGLINYRLHIRKGFSTSTGLLRFAQDINADMLALGTHSRKGLIHFFAGSISEDVVNRSPWPVWTYSLESS